MQKCARADQRLVMWDACGVQKDVSTPLLGWTRATGASVHVVNEPYSLKNQIGNEAMTSTQVHQQFADCIDRVLFLEQSRIASGVATYTEYDVYELALAQSVFARTVARARSSTRATAVFGALFGVDFDEKFLQEYEIANNDPFSAAVGTLMDYDPELDVANKLDPETELQSAFETDQKSSTDYQNMIGDTEPGKKLFLQFLSGRLLHQSEASVVDPSSLGILGEFF